MNGVPLAFDHVTDRAAFRRPAHRAGIELYQAHIVRHAFEPHTHDAYGLGAIESGVERFRYRGSDWKNFDTNLCIVEKTDSFCPSVITRRFRKSKTVS